MVLLLCFDGKFDGKQQEIPFALGNFRRSGFWF
jgi:hypothetical protein